MVGHVFVSYGRGDRPVARRVAQALYERGFDVWWDPKIEPGVAYDRVIERALKDATCVVALWSADSVESDWVRAEADDGRKRGMLVPVLIEAVEPPLQFRLIETVDLTGWRRGEGDDGLSFDRLEQSICRHAAPVDWTTRWRTGLATGIGLHRGVLGPHGEWVSSARFFGDATALTASGDGVLRRWTLPDGAAADSVRAHSGSIWSSAVHKSFIATGGADGSVGIWDVASLAPLHRIGDLEGWVLTCAVSRHGDLLATGSRDATVRLWDTATWAERAVLVGHRGAVWSAVFSPDGDRLLTASDDQTVRVWSVSSGHQLCVMRGHSAPVMACLPLPDGETALSGGYDQRVLRWDVRTGAVVGSLEGSTGWVLSLAVAADGGLAVAGTSTGSVHAWDLASGALIGTAAPHTGPVMSVDFRTGVGLLSGSADETAALLGVAPFERVA